MSTKGMERTHALIIVALLVILISVCCAVWALWILPSPGKTAEWEPDRIPEDLKEVWDTIRLHRNFSICRWEFDSQEKQAFLYVIDIRDENDVRDLQGARINNWTIQVFYDAEYEKERNLAWEAFMNIEKDPGLDIAAFDMGSDEVIMWVWNLTPENQALDGKVIHGRRIFICVSPTPPPARGPGI